MRTYVLSFFLLLCCLPVSAQWIRMDKAVPSVLQDLYFFDQNNGFVVGSDDLTTRGGKIFHTTDAGKTWAEVLHDPHYRHEVAAIDFQNELNGIAVGHSQVFYKTEDGGQSWDSLIHPGEPVLFESVQMLGSNIGYAGNWRGEILKTTDGGTSWELSLDPGPQWSSVFHLSCLDEETCYAGVSQRFYKTEDGGANWNFVSGVTYLKSHWWDEMNGIAVEGLYATGEIGFVQKTSDGGETWREVALGVDLRVNAMAFKNGVGYVGGRGTVGGMNETIMKSTNFGETWEIVHEHIGGENQSTVNDIFIIDETHAFASTGDGTILKFSVEEENPEETPGVIVFPNPFLERINFALPYFIEAGEFEVYNATGRKVDHQKPPSGTYFYYENNELAPGIYYYKLDLKKEIGFEKETITGKMIKR